MPPKTETEKPPELPECVEKVISLMQRLKWRRVRNDLLIVQVPERNGRGYGNLLGSWPVFEVGARRCVIGPTWTTFYSVEWRSIVEGTLRSVKTRDIETVEAEAEGTRHQIDVGGES